MTKKKHFKSEDTDQNKIDDVADNKAINSQEESKSRNQKENLSEEPDNTGTGGDNKIPGADEAKDTAKEASQKESPEAKLAEMQDRYLRLSAEFDNYRKRTLREKIELTKHAGENILISIVPVMDDFERALKLMGGTTDCIAMKSGIDLIYNKFKEFLKQNGIREIESANSEFNVDLHEAITKIPVEDPAMKGKVVEVVEKGYYLHDKVMRFSKVVVGE